MKNPNDYTLEEINKIWYDNQPGSLTKAYQLLVIRCENLEKQLKQANDAEQSDSNCNIPLVSGSLPVLNKESALKWLKGLRDSCYSERNAESTEMIIDMYDGLINDIERLWQ